ncbi:unnamed protein product [Closterium sp. NIES-64]|nr:unnamed protein product [Closterium sp. NIES-64]
MPLSSSPAISLISLADPRRPRLCLSPALPVVALASPSPVLPVVALASPSPVLPVAALALPSPALPVVALASPSPALLLISRSPPQRLRFPRRHNALASARRPRLPTYPPPSPPHTNRLPPHILFRFPASPFALIPSALLPPIPFPASPHPLPCSPHPLPCFPLPSALLPPSPSLLPPTLCPAPPHPLPCFPPSPSLLLPIPFPASPHPLPCFPPSRSLLPPIPFPVSVLPVSLSLFPVSPHPLFLFLHTRTPYRLPTLPPAHLTTFPSHPRAGVPGRCTCFLVPAACCPRLPSHLSQTTSFSICASPAGPYPLLICAL